MGKGASRKIGSKRANKNIESLNNSDGDKKELLEKKLLELEDSEIEALFKAGKIDQAEYEYIIAFRKKKKEKKKSQKEKFEERIRCNENIIKKVIDLGKKFRLQELFRQSESRKISELNRTDELLEKISEDDKDIEREERIRTKNEQTRGRNSRSLDRDERRFGGRGRERDR